MWHVGGRSHQHACCALLFCSPERPDEVRPVAVGHALLTKAVSLGPAITRAIVRAEQSIDPRQVHGKVLIACVSLRTVMPMVKARCHDPVLHAAKTEAH